MNLKKIGKSNVEVTEIAFGAWAVGGWMWGGTDYKLSVRAIQRAIDLGMTTIDTAPAYGFGLSEKIVGEAIRGKKDKVQILTKYGLRWNTDKGRFFFNSRSNEGKPARMHKYASKASVLIECEESLKRLGIDCIDLYQIHWPDPTTSIEETMEAIDLLIQQGKIKASGVCNYNVNEMKTAAAIVPLASNQVPYSMVKREIEKDVVPYCIRNHIGIIAYSPLQRGVLTGKITHGYKFGEGDNREDLPYFKGENLYKINHFLQKIKTIAEDREITLPQLVINWTMKQPGITCVLVGARSPEQVEENTRAAGFELTDEEINVINNELDKLKLDI
ncbi:MAG: aldo/keto reductase [Bacteroidales bacterium]|nr:aldo/keto reductase [Bacteroidales bacterium]